MDVVAGLFESSGSEGHGHLTGQSVRTGSEGFARQPEKYKLD